MIPIFSSCFFSLYVTLIFHVFPYVFGESSLLLSSSWLYMFNSNQTTTAKDELCFIGLSRYIFPLWRFCFHLAIILLCNVIICSFFSLQNVYVFFLWCWLQCIHPSCECGDSYYQRLAFAFFHHSLITTIDYITHCSFIFFSKWAAAAATNNVEKWGIKPYISMEFSSFSFHCSIEESKSMKEKTIKTMREYKNEKKDGSKGARANPLESLNRTLVGSEQWIKISNNKSHCA